MKEKDFDNEYNYRIYIASEGEGYELQCVTKKEEKVKEYCDKCEQCDWNLKMFVVRHDIMLNMDEPYMLKIFPEKGKSYELGKSK